MNLSKYLIVGALLASVLPTQAETSLIIHGVSKHSGSKIYNESNEGVGVRHQVDTDLSVQAGTYNNSFNRRSTYVLANYTPLHYGGFSAGVFSGLSTGYRSDVIGGLVVQYDFGKVFVTTRIAKDVATVVALELGVKF